MTTLTKIDLKGVEDWREYDFGNRVYRIHFPVSVEFHAGSTTHRVTDDKGIVHIVPAPGQQDCVIRFKGRVVA
jgi:hypothetical protein